MISIDDVITQWSRGESNPHFLIDHLSCQMHQIIIFACVRVSKTDKSGASCNLLVSSACVRDSESGALKTMRAAMLHKMTIKKAGHPRYSRGCPIIFCVERYATSTSFYGPSVEIRTRGLLNPIQARYQTSPHPDMQLCFAHCVSLITIPQFQTNCKRYFQKIKKFSFSFC